jgi:hypothetical protein
VTIRPEAFGIPARPQQPVELLWERDHEFVAKGKKKTKGERCQECGRGFTVLCHHGYPRSLNTLGSGNRFAFQQAKHAWQEIWDAKLGAAELGACQSIYVECQITFPDLKPRDEGNMRFMLEKSFGDALKAGGYLPDDTFWPAMHYRFGSIEGTHEPGRAATRLILFPS